MPTNRLLAAIGSFRFLAKIREVLWSDNASYAEFSTVTKTASDGKTMLRVLFLH